MAHGDHSRREALHCEGVHVPLPVSAQIFTIMIIRSKNNISLKLPAHPPPCYCTHTQPQQIITHCRVHRKQIFLQSKSLTHHIHRPPTVQSIHTAHKIGKQFLDLRRANLTQQQQQNLNILKMYIYLTD